MILLTAIFILLETWFDPGWVPSQLRVVQLWFAWAAVVALVLCYWQLRRFRRELTTAILIGLVAAVGLNFYFGPLHTAIGYSHDPTLKQADEASWWTLAVMGGWLALVVSGLVHGDRARRMCIGCGAVCGLLIGRTFLLALPEATYYNWPGAAAWLWVPAAAGMALGWDAAELLPSLRARRLEKPALAVLAIVIVAGLAFRVADVSSGAYRCYSIPELEHSRCVSGLVFKLNHGRSSMERGDAAYSLGVIRASAATGVLAAVLAGKKPDRRPQIPADTLGNKEYPRQSAATALGYIGGDEAFRALIHALSDPSADVRDFAARALGYTRSKRAVPHLIRMLKDPDRVARFFVPSALAKIGDKSAVPALISTVNNDPELREQAIYALGSLNDRRAVQCVEASLSDPGWSVRYSAVIVLGQLGGPSAISAVSKVLDDPDNSVRYKAADVVRSLRAKMVRPGSRRVDEQQ